MVDRLSRPDPPAEARSFGCQDFPTSTRRIAVTRPFGHQTSPLLKQGTPPIGCFGLVLHRMSQGRLDNPIRKVGGFTSPIAK